MRAHLFAKRASGDTTLHYKMTTAISDYMNDPVTCPFSKQLALVNELLVAGKEEILI